MTHLVLKLVPHQGKSQISWRLHSTLAGPHTRVSMHYPSPCVLRYVFIEGELTLMPPLSRLESLVVVLECTFRWSQTMPSAISTFEKNAPSVKKATSLIAEDDVEEEKDDDDDDDDGPSPLMSGSESEDDDDDEDSASSDDDTPVAPKKKATKAEVSFAQLVQKVARSATTSGALAVTSRRSSTRPAR